MTTYESLYNYWHFSRRYSQFEILFHLIQKVLPLDHEVSDGTRQKLVLLDKQRRMLQTKIWQRSQPLSAIHSKCGGSCCRGKTEYYFTGVDFWLRKFSGNTVESFGMPSGKSWKAVVERRVRRVLRRSTLPKQRETGEKCRFLGRQGCILDAESRPIQCIVFTCGNLRQTMDRRTKTEYRDLINELYDVSLRTLHILEKEAKVSCLPSRVSLSFVLGSLIFFLEIPEDMLYLIPESLEFLF